MADSSFEMLKSLEHGTISPVISWVKSKASMFPGNSMVDCFVFFLEAWHETISFPVVNQHVGTFSSQPSRPGIDALEDGEQLDVESEAEWVGATLKQLTQTQGPGEQDGEVCDKFGCNFVKFEI